MIKKYIDKVSILTLLLIAFSSCSLERLESAQEVAEGGGTIDTFTAYTIDSTDPMGSDVYGRIVFWKTDLDQTLVQVSVYNTEYESIYPTGLLSGTIGDNTTTLTELPDVEGFQFVSDEPTDEIDENDLDGDGNVDELLPDVNDLDSDGDTGEPLPIVLFFGEFSEKFFLISDTTFYDSINELDSHINIYDTDGITILAEGNIGVNAMPVDSN